MAVRCSIDDALNGRADDIEQTDAPFPASDGPRFGVLSRRRRRPIKKKAMKRARPIAGCLGHHKPPPDHQELACESSIGEVT